MPTKNSKFGLAKNKKLKFSMFMQPQPSMLANSQNKPHLKNRRTKNLVSTLFSTRNWYERGKHKAWSSIIESWSDCTRSQVNSQNGSFSYSSANDLFQGTKVAFYRGYIPPTLYCVLTLQKPPFSYWSMRIRLAFRLARRCKEEPGNDEKWNVDVRGRGTRGKTKGA